MARPKQQTAKHLPPHYLVTVQGTYYDRGNGKKEIKPYEFKFPVPAKVKAEIPERRFDAEKQRHFYETITKEVHIDEYGILRFLKTSNKLQDKVESIAVNFSGIREHTIVNVEPSHEDLTLPDNPYVLNLIQLRQLVRDRGWGIDLKIFNSLKSLREAVINYKEDPQSYKTYEDKFKQRNAIRSAFSENMESLENYYDSLEQLENEPLIGNSDDKTTI